MFRTFTFAPARREGDRDIPTESADDYNVVIRKFTEYCVPRKNVVYERYQFNTRNQQEGESNDAYVTDLRLKAATCEFGELHDSMIRDRIVVGVREGKLTERMLRDPVLTLVGAMELCRAAETTQAQMKVLNPVECWFIGV